GVQPPVLRVAADLRGNAVRGEHHDRAGRHLVYLRHEDGAAFLKRADDVRVVYDLPAYIDRGTELVQGHLDRLHSAVNSGAVAARLSEQDPPLARRHASMVGEHVLVPVRRTPATVQVLRHTERGAKITRQGTRADYQRCTGAGRRNGP